MKKIFVLLLSGLFLYGCGSGGDTPTASNVSNTNSGGSISTPVKNFTLTLVDSAKVASKTVLPAAGSAPVPTDVRVVIRHYVDVSSVVWGDTGAVDPEGYEIDGNITVHTYTLDYHDIQDMTYGNTITVGIPVGTFQIDVITSKKETNNYSTLKHGYNGTVIVTAAGGSATIPMSSIGAELNMSVADTVTTNGAFNVAINGYGPFAKSCTMTMNFNGSTWTDSTHFTSFTPVTTTTTDTSISFKAPYSYDASKKVSLQGTFTLDPLFMKIGENSANWTRVFPRADYGESVYSDLNQFIPFTVPGLNN